jgi:hypothetical protein
MLIRSSQFQFLNFKIVCLCICRMQLGSTETVNNEKLILQKNTKLQ